MKANQPEGVENSTEKGNAGGPGQKKDAGTQGKGLDNTVVSSSSTSMEFDSSSSRTNSVMTNRSSGAYKSWSPIVFGRSAQHGNPSGRGCQKYGTDGTSDRELLA